MFVDELELDEVELVEDLYGNTRDDYESTYGFNEDDIGEDGSFDGDEEDEDSYLERARRCARRVFTNEDEDRFGGDYEFDEFEDDDEEDDEEDEGY